MTLLFREEILRIYFQDNETPGEFQKEMRKNNKQIQRKCSMKGTESSCLRELSKLFHELAYSKKYIISPHQLRKFLPNEFATSTEE